MKDHLITWQSKLSEKCHWHLLLGWLLAGGLFILLLSCFFSLYCLRQLLVKDHLIALAPQKTVLYVQARISVWPEDESNLTGLPFGKYQAYLEEKYFSKSSSLKQLLAESNQAAMAMVADEKKQLQPIFYFELADHLNLIQRQRELNGSFIIGDTLIYYPNMESEIDFPKDLIKERGTFAKNNLMASQDASRLKIYWPKNSLQDNFWSKKYPLSDLMALSNRNYLINFNFYDSGWQFKVESIFSLLPRTQPPLISSLPKDFTLLITQVSLQNILQQYVLPLSSSTLSYEQFTEVLKSSFGFDPAKKMPTLTQAKGDWLLMQSTTSSNVSSTDFILVLPTISPAEINETEIFFTYLLSWRLPSEENYLLPDETTVKELVMKPEVWQWQTVKAGEYDLRVLSEPRINFSLAYTTTTDRIIFGSSPEVLDKYLTQEARPLNEVLTSVDLKHRFMILDTQKLDPSLGLYLPDGLVVLREDKYWLWGRVIE